MTLNRHCSGRICNTVRELCKRVAGAGHNDQHIEHPLRPDRLRTRNAVDDLAASDIPQTFTQIIRRAEPCIHTAGMLAQDWCDAVTE